LYLLVYNFDKSICNVCWLIANTFDKNNLTTSILQPLPISIIKLDDSYEVSSSSPSSTLEETTANYKNYNALKNSNPSSEINLIENNKIPFVINSNNIGRFYNL
jgi:hypothetical protein